MERATGKFETIINVKEAKIPIFIGKKSPEQSMKIIQTPFLLWLDKMSFGKKNKIYSYHSWRSFVLLTFLKWRDLKYISTFSKLQSLFGGNFIPLPFLFLMAENSW